MAQVWFLVHGGSQPFVTPSNRVWSLRLASMGIRNTHGAQTCMQAKYLHALKTTVTTANRTKLTKPSLFKVKIWHLWWQSIFWKDEESEAEHNNNNNKKTNIETVRRLNNNQDIFLLCCCSCCCCLLLHYAYRFFTRVLDSRYHRLNSIEPEISIARPPWISILAFSPDCSWIS